MTNQPIFCYNLLARNHSLKEGEPMVQEATVDRKKFVDGDENFPILYEGGGLRVFRNPSGEIFVEDILTSTRMRISAYPAGAGGLQFTANGRVDPLITNGCIGWRIR